MKSAQMRSTQMIQRLVPFIIGAILLANPTTGNGQDYYEESEIRFDNYIYDDNIRSVKLMKGDWENIDPIIKLKSGEQFMLKFDDLSGVLRNLGYTFYHCDANWERSQLMEIEYMGGMLEDLVYDYEYSRNTRQKYVHYKLPFPNQNIQLTKSGNYVLVVHDLDEGHEPVLSMRFMILEERVSIRGDYKMATRAEHRYEKQEVDFIIYTQGTDLVNIYQNLHVNISQNQRWDNAVMNLQPLFTKNNELVYNYEDINLFDGGNEFRFFDTRNLNYRAQTTQQIGLVEDTNVVWLIADESRAAQSYLFQRDINGRYLIKNDDLAWDHDIDADYVKVNFYLQDIARIPQGDIYIFGELSNWKYRNEFKMVYDSKRRWYTNTLYLKQGYYNYQYIYFEDGQESGDISRYEGNHSQTENEYSIFCYYRNPGDIYDRLIGYLRIVKE